MPGGLEFDPTSERASNAPLDVWANASYVTTAFSAPAPPTSVQWASSVDTEGALPASQKDENRTIQMTVDCRSAAALRALQAKVAKASREGGTLKLTLPASEVVIFDLLARDSFEPQLDISYFANNGAFCTVNLSLTARPYGRGPERDLGDNVETTLPVLIFTDTNIPGDVPGLGRLVIDEDQGQAQRTVIWGVQSRYYDAAAPLFFQAESGTPGSATSASVAGASGGNAMYNANLQTGLNWATDFSITGGHVGTFRVIARVQGPPANVGATRVRMRWAANNQALTTNTQVSLYASASAAWLLADLGTITAKLPPVGTPSVKLEFQSQANNAGDDIYWDWIALVPVLEGWGQLEASASGSDRPLPANGQLQIAHDHIRSQSGGQWSVQHAAFYGRYLTIPPSGPEGRTLRVIVKATRGRVRPHKAQNDADAGIDDISAHLYVTPRYLVVPELTP